MQEVWYTTMFSDQLIAQDIDLHSGYARPYRLFQILKNVCQPSARFPHQPDLSLGLNIDRHIYSLSGILTEDFRDG